METHLMKRNERHPTKKEDNNLDRLNRRTLHHSRLLLMFLIMMAMMTTTVYATTPPVPVSPEAVAETSAIPPAISNDPLEYAPDAAVPLSSDGNLTLLDDVQENLSGNLQFLTVRTKAGNTFYLIVDRSAEQNNVHFLNLVDEADLLALLKQEDGFGATGSAGVVPNGTAGATGAADVGIDAGGFAMQWPSASEKANRTVASAAGGSAASTAVPDTGSASQSGDGQVSDAGSASVVSTNTMQPTQSGQATQSGASASAPTDLAKNLPFSEKVTAYLSLALILLLMIAGAVIWLVRRHRKKKQLRAKHPLDEYLYVEEMEEREETEPADSTDTHRSDGHSQEEEYDREGEEDLV